MFQAFANIARIADLRRKFLMTLGLVAICRIGVYIPLPGIDLDQVREFVRQASEGPFGRVMVLFDVFSGGAMRNGSILALGIMPYISAAIIFQLLVAVVPSLERIAREGESGRRRINQYTRYAAVVLCLIQAMITAGQVRQWVIIDYWKFRAIAMVSMTAGTLFLMWMGEQIDEFGLGNGISLIIMTNIISRLPAALKSLGEQLVWKLGGTGPSTLGPERLLILIGVFVFMIVAVVFITQAQRRVPMNHARRTREGFSHRSYLPLKVNMAGVIAIIFAQSVMMLPGFLARIPNRYAYMVFSHIEPWKFFYVAFYMSLIIFFSYFYTAIVFNPVEKANEFKQYGAFIPGIRPGRRTAEYLERIMSRITLAGAMFVAVIAVAPQVISGNMGVSILVGQFFGGTSLLITVGVALDLVQRIESYMMMQAYEGFMKGGRIRGRRG